MMAGNLILQDIPRAYTAFAEWLSCLLLFGFVEHKVKGLKLVLFSLCMFGVQMTFLVLTDHQKNVLWVLCMLVAISLMYLFIWHTVKCDALSAFFHCCEAFLLAEFMASAEWMVSSYFVLSGGEIRLTRILCFVLTYGSCICLFGWLNRYLFPKKHALMVNQYEVLIAFLIAAIIFVVSNISFIYANTPLSGSYYTIFQLRTVIDLGGVAIIYAYHIQIQNIHMMQDMVKLEAMLQAQYQQYTTSREVQENINYKYHDLKQYIAIMRQKIAREEETQILDRIESEIRTYETQNQTGNHVLDTLLSSKGMACQNQEILLTTVVNGELLSFMDTMDICSIFGNALDNAIEYEKNISDPKKRMINLRVFEQNHAFLVIRVDNFYEGTGPIKLKDKLPMTTKRDASLHGYGLRSIQHAVHKYGGEMDIGVKAQWFSLRILIPLADKKQPDK